MPCCMASLRSSSMVAERIAVDLTAAQWIFDGDTVSMSASIGFCCSSLIDGPTLSNLLGTCDRDLYKNKWIRKHPDLRPELYEYPAHDRDVVERLRDMRG